ncbi:MAG TPA: L,D-transpeptidase [Candidatus Saccharimonadales bacterium]|nr:L,D-transpeptidase [Candidatus Saccharimonadales bacterium]
MKIKLLVILILLAACVWIVHARHDNYSVPKSSALSGAQTASAKTSPTTKTAKTAPPVENQCASNTSGKKVIVDISQQHMWACQDAEAVYNNAVITGMEQYDDSTPLGTYHIFSRLTDQTLKGCDATGCWNDPVSYWLPYQQASGGTVGFHDANWRKPTDFGHITPSSNKGSHGCVEMPLSAAKWLFGWATVGTTVVVKA